MNEFSPAQRKELLKIAREAILSHFDSPISRNPRSPNPEFQAHRGAFVTLHLEGKLRGCIGHPLPVAPLARSVAENAVAAAFKDPRFPPLTREEYDRIDLEISVLTRPKSILSPEDVEVGRDGIIISKGIHRGLLLPQVPVEQNWDRDEYLSYGCLKAGLPDDAWKKGAEIQTFQAEVFGEKEGTGEEDGG